MADDSKYSSDYSKQTDSYIKFLIYHLLIIVTIVFSLYNAVKKVGDEDVADKVRQVIALRDISQTIPLNTISDRIIKGVYFENASCSSPLPDLLVKRDRLLLPDSTISDSLRKRLSDSLTVVINTLDSAISRQTKLLKEIEAMSAKAFQLKLSFLGDAQVDLRLWIFVLPFIFLLSCIYIFILDEKIWVLKRQAFVLGSPVPVDLQYPFNFLRSLLLFAEIFLVLFYIYIILLFFNVQASSLRNYVLYAVLFFIYYGFVYCMYFTERIRLGTVDGIKQFRLYRRLAIVWKRKVALLTKINPFGYLGTGQLLLLATLLLMMTYKGCNEKGDFAKKDLRNGYELIVDKVYWEVNTENYSDYAKGCEHIQDDSRITDDRTLSDVTRIAGFIFYKYFYALLILVALVSFSWYKGKRTTLLFKIPFFIVICAVFIYTIFFGLYRLFNYPGYSLPVSLFCMLYWYFSFYRRTDDPAFFGIGHLKGLIIFLFPLIVLSLINTIANFNHRNGWIFFYVSLWLLLLAMIFLSPYKQVIRKTKTTPTPAPA